MDYVDLVESSRREITMNKKIMLLALGVSTVLCALPSVVSAQEIHLEGMSSAWGSGGASTIIANGESPITCESVDAEGVIAIGGTTGNLSLDFTGCHTTVFGLTAKCRVSGSPLDNTIKETGTLHLITVSSGRPGILMTPSTIEIVCAGISNTRIEPVGVIGTVTRPSCGASSSELTVTFSTAGGGVAQEDTVYTGFTYYLKAKTNGGELLAAGLTSTFTLKSEWAGKLNCT
jgi:hypothetical protein